MTPFALGILVTIAALVVAGLQGYEPGETLTALAGLALVILALQLFRRKLRRLRDRLQPSESHHFTHGGTNGQTDRYR